MTRKLLVTLLVLWGVGFWGVAAAAPPTAPSINCEPVLVYDVTGFARPTSDPSTIGGPVHMHLAVYSDGNASISSSMWFGEKESTTAEASRVVDVETASVPMPRVARLLDELVAAGALDMADQTFGRGGRPLRTLTLMGSELVVVHVPRPTPSEIDLSYAYLQGKVNTFSFYVDIPQISSIVDRFIDEVF